MTVLRFLSVGVLLFVALTAWALSSPISSGPDDGFHLSSIWCSSEGIEGVCEPGSDSQHRLVAPALFDAPNCFAYQPKQSAACQINSGILDNFNLVDTDVGNFAGGYPPVYYAFMHLFATKEIVFSALMMRLANISIFVFGALTLWAIAPKSTRSIQRLMWVVTLVPLGLFLIGSNNPSSWALMGIGFSSISLISFFRTNRDDRIRKWSLALFYLIFTLVGAGSRGDSAAFVVLEAVLICIICLQSLKISKTQILLPTLGSLIGLFFFFSSGHAGVAEEGFGESIDTKAGTPFAILGYNLARLPNLFIGIFAGEEWGLGWLDTKMPETVWVSALVVFFSVLVISWQKMSKLSAIALTAIVAATALIPLYVLQRSELTIGQVVQPRYVYPLVILTAVIALSTQKEILNFGSRYWRWFVTIAISVAGPLALYVNMSRYINGLDTGASYNLNIEPEWWWVDFPLQPMTVLFWGSISFVCLVASSTRPWSKSFPEHSSVPESPPMRNGQVE